MKLNLLFLILILFFLSIIPLLGADEHENTQSIDDVKNEQIHHLSSSEDESINNYEDTPLIIEARDVENEEVQLEIDFLARSYKGQTNSYFATPMLLRIDSGNGTEFRITTDFLTYQEPNLGFNDVTLGLKWHFHESNPSMGVMFSLELPVGGAGFPVLKPQPEIKFLCDYSINDKLTLSGNIALSRQVYDRYDSYQQQTYAGALSYSINDSDNCSAGFIAVNPYTMDGPCVVRMAAGYSHRTEGKTIYSFYILKGLSSVDRNWQMAFGISYLWSKK